MQLPCTFQMVPHLVLHLSSLISSSYICVGVACGLLRVVVVLVIVSVPLSPVFDFPYPELEKEVAVVALYFADSAVVAVVPMFLQGVVSLLDFCCHLLLLFKLMVQLPKLSLSRCYIFLKLFLSQCCCFSMPSLLLNLLGQ